MSKQIIFGDLARKKIIKGANAVADAVKVTIGPRGRNVILDKGYGGPQVTNDGVSIAKEITLKDKFENMGAEIIKEVATKTNNIAGDGTSTSVILAQAIIEDGMRQVTMGVNAMMVRTGIERAVNDAVAELKKRVKTIKTKEEITQVATISSESREIGEIIAETIESVGKDGVVTVEESQSIGVDKEVVEGMEIDKGYVSLYMVTNADRMEAESKEPVIIVTDKKVSSIKEILPLLEQIVQKGQKEVVIIADDIDGEALSTFVVNKLRGTFNVLGIKAPGYGDNKKAMLEDIAVTVGATLISDEVGLSFDKVGMEVLGRARKVVATKDKTIIVDGKGKKQTIESRVSQLKKQAEMTDSKFDKEKIEQRIAKLSGGVAVIKVGAATETEMKYLKLKIEDAVNATKAAIDEGIVSGGGTALAKIAAHLEKNVPKDVEKVREMHVGYMIVLKALEAPLKQIVNNCGRGDGSVILEKVKTGKPNEGYDALNDVMVLDMILAGIVDPVKVTRAGLEHAASAAAILLTTEAAIAEEPEEKKPIPPGMGDMGDMGMGY